MLRHSKYSSPYGRGKKGAKLGKDVPNDMEGKRLVPDDPDPANGRGKAIMYGGANLDAVSPGKLDQLIKTFEGKYLRPNIDKGWGSDQPYGEHRLFERKQSYASGGLIDRPYGADIMSPGQVPWHAEFNSDHDFTAPTRILSKFTTSGDYPRKELGGYMDSGGEMDQYAKGGNWIQGAVNPKHKGYCTPMTKSTCTGARRRFALTMKAHHGFHSKAEGGVFGTDPKDGAKDEMKLVSWKSQGLTSPDTLSRGAMYQAPWRVFNSRFGTAIPKGVDPESQTYLANPQALPSTVRKVTTYDIAGNPTSATHAQGDLPSLKRAGGTLAQIRRRPGGSNVGKKTFANGKKRTGPYAGPSGGAPSGSYPIPDIGHARAALRLSGHAPNPGGIKAAVYRKFPQLKKSNGGRFSYTAGLSGWKGGASHG